jgi:hypothetical protein
MKGKLFKNRFGWEVRVYRSNNIQYKRYDIHPEDSTKLTDKDKYKIVEIFFVHSFLTEDDVWVDDICENFKTCSTFARITWEN